MSKVCEAIMDCFKNTTDCFSADGAVGGGIAEHPVMSGVVCAAGIVATISCGICLCGKCLYRRTVKQEDGASGGNLVRSDSTSANSKITSSNGGMEKDPVVSENNTVFIGESCDTIDDSSNLQILFSPKRNHLLAMSQMIESQDEMVFEDLKNKID
jgi:hypothetical protein